MIKNSIAQDLWIGLWLVVGWFAMVLAVAYICRMAGC